MPNGVGQITAFTAAAVVLTERKRRRQHTIPTLSHTQRPRKQKANTMEFYGRIGTGPTSRDVKSTMTKWFYELK